MSKIKSLIGVFTLTALVVVMSGCKQQGIVDKVVFKPADDLSTIRVSLQFKQKIQSTMAGGFDLKYGQFFITPYAETQPFEIGFDLDMNIFYEQDYVGLQPTMTLPNGLPIGIPYPVVEVKSPNPIHPKFDMYGYVDVGHQSWLGVAAMFNFLNDQYFPTDLSVSQVFMRDTAGSPAILASVFGPTLDENGSLLRNGGIGLFVNARQLIEKAQGRADTTMTFYPEKRGQVIGAAADQYGNKKSLRKLEKKLIRGLNLN